MAWGLLASPTCPPNGPSNTKFSAFPSNSAAFEPVSAWRRSLLPGNAILRPETKARKWPLESTWPLAETTHQQASPPIRGFSPKAGKSPFSRTWHQMSMSGPAVARNISFGETQEDDTEDLSCDTEPQLRARGASGSNAARYCWERPRIWCCSDHSAGKSARRVPPLLPRGPYE